MAPKKTTKDVVVSASDVEAPSPTNTTKKQKKPKKTAATSNPIPPPPATTITPPTVVVAPTVVEIPKKRISRRAPKTIVISPLPSTEEEEEEEKEEEEEPLEEENDEIEQEEIVPVKPVPTPVPVSSLAHVPKPSPPKAPISIDEKEAEESLKKLGYTIVSKIMKDTKELIRSKEPTAYIKVITPRGEKALVQLDKEGMKPKINQGDVVYTLASESSMMIPSTVKTGYSRCLNPSVCGLVLECDTEICTITRIGNDTIPQEVSFSLMNQEKPAKKIAIIDSQSGVMAYPIVRYSEIVQDSDSVIDNIHENVVDIHKYAIRMNYTTSEQLMEVLQSYPQQISKFTNMQGEILQKIGSVINELNSYYDDYRIDSITEDQENFDIVKKNLKMYNDLYSKIIQDGQWLVSLKVMEQFARFSTHLSQAIDYIKNITPSVGEVLTD